MHFEHWQGHAATRAYCSAWAVAPAKRLLAFQAACRQGCSDQCATFQPASRLAAIPPSLASCVLPPPSACVRLATHRAQHKVAGGHAHAGGPLAHALGVWLCGEQMRLRQMSGGVGCHIPQVEQTQTQAHQSAAVKAAGCMQCVCPKHPPAMAMMRSTSAGFKWQRTARAPTYRAKGRNSSRGMIRSGLSSLPLLLKTACHVLLVAPLPPTKRRAPHALKQLHAPDQAPNGTQAATSSPAAPRGGWPSCCAARGSPAPQPAPGPAGWFVKGHV